MRVRPIIAVSALAAAVLLAPWPASAATTPGTGCPADFQLAPVSVLGSNFAGIADNVNHDGFICIRSLHDGSRIFIDNTTP
ncbi:MAG: hypothetical protein ABJA34_10885 [Pseudonocardiales bacterium]